MTSVFIVCGSVCLCFWIALVKANPKNIELIKNILVVYRLDENGVSEVDEDKVRFGFWTPSPETWKGKMAPDNDKWEEKITTEKLNEFAQQLRETGRVSGFRRYDVDGRGRGELKTGLWWIVTVDDSYSKDEFNDLYRKFWKNPDAIYLEVTGERREVTKKKPVSK